MRCKRACVHVVCPDFNWLTGGRGIAYFKLVNILFINVHAKSYFVFQRTLLVVIKQSVKQYDTMLFLSLLTLHDNCNFKGDKM